MAAQSSQKARIFMWDGATPANHVISGVTKASPAVVAVVSATGLAVGDIVKPSGTGFKSIDDLPFRVSVVSSLNITLEDSDTTDETGTATTGDLDEYNLVEICLASFNQEQPAGTVIDVTTMCDTARKTLAGLPGQGTWTANGFYDANDASQVIARNAYRSGDPWIFRAQFGDSSGFMFAGALNQLSHQMAVDAAVTVTWGGTVSGRTQFQPAA